MQWLWDLGELAVEFETIIYGVEGAIAGTALYEGRFTIEDALALTRRGDQAR